MIIPDAALIDRVHVYFLTEMMRIPDRTEEEWQALALACAVRLINSAEISIQAALVRSQKVVSIDRPRTAARGEA